MGEETSLSATTDSGMLGTSSQSTSQSTGSSVCSSYGVVAQPRCGSASQSSVVGSNLSFQRFHNTSVTVGSALGQQVSRHPKIQTNVFNTTPPMQSPQVPQHHFGFISGVPPPPYSLYTPWPWSCCCNATCSSKCSSCTVTTTTSCCIAILD